MSSSFFFSSRRRHTRWPRDWSSDVCSSDLVTAHDLYSVQRSVLSNNAQVLTMGERVVGLELAKELVKVWLGLEFDPNSSSAAKVDAICAYDGSLEQS